MKKSILWTAAGVVSATALWAAISLPQHSPVRPSARQAVIACSVVVEVDDPNDGLGMSVSLSTEPSTLEWSGNIATIHSKTTSTTIGSPTSALHPTTLTITRTTQERGSNFSRCSRQSITRTFQPGDTFRL
ncbi:hypothetical protein [Armatimonas sp.]|uniref:hypothetical protein n=1 Tax=Armatimonas sp. TaxID=1872638 RepID=UPI003750E1E0